MPAVAPPATTGRLAQLEGALEDYRLRVRSERAAREAAERENAELRRENAILRGRAA